MLGTATVGRIGSRQLLRMPSALCRPSVSVGALPSPSWRGCASHWRRSSAPFLLLWGLAPLLAWGGAAPKTGGATLKCGMVALGHTVHLAFLTGPQELAVDPAITVHCLAMNMRQPWTLWRGYVRLRRLVQRLVRW